MSALLRHEIRSILASFRRRPLVPLIAATMLALGIGSNMAVFTVISRTLLRPLPYARPDRLLVISTTFIEPDKKEELTPSGSVEIVQWQKRSSQFSAIEAVKANGMTLREGSDPQGVDGGVVTGGIFRLFGVRPVLGRDFSREDDVPEARVAIISYGLWQRRFGAATTIIGHTVLIDGRPVEIIGVLPRGFEVAAVTPQPDVFIPAGLSPAHMPTPGSRAYAVFGRLREGVSPRQGQSDLRRISAQLAREYPATHEHNTATVQSLREAAFGERRQSLVTLWLMVALVHILACVNVATLLSAQIADERGLTALRLVLGAGRKHILRYRLMESLLITTAGGLAGFAIGALALRLVLLSQSDPALTVPVEHAWELPAFLVGISLLSGVLVALFPALRETHTRLSSALNEQGNRASSSVGGTRLRELFMIVEVALAVPLLLAAATMVQHFRDLQRVSLGFDPSHVMVAQIVMPSKYDKSAGQRLPGS
ncbi:MAG: ABC transporter permease [Acidobacteriota bacterium]